MAEDKVDGKTQQGPAGVVAMGDQNKRQMKGTREATLLQIKEEGEPGLRPRFTV